MTQTTKLPVKIYAIASMKFEGSTDDLSQIQPDVFAPECLGGDRCDLGTDSHIFSSGSDDEKVIVDKGLLLALIEQCQSTSSNESIYDDNRGTSYKWADLENHVWGMAIPDYILTNTPPQSQEQQLYNDRKAMADGILSEQDFGELMVTDTGSWAVNGDKWTTSIYLEDGSTNKVTKELIISFQHGFTNTKSVRLV